MDEELDYSIEEQEEPTLAEETNSAPLAEEEENKSSGQKDDKDAKSVSADLIRGHINTIILRSLADGDKYGYEIIAEIENKSHGQYSLKQPSLYSALKRLESQGYVTSYWGGSVGGGRRKYFSLTEEGVQVTEQNRSEWEYSRTIIDSLISDKDFDFSNPAPTIVNMRVLKSGTSRVPSRDGGEEDELDFDPSFPLPVQSTEELEKLQAQIKELEQKLKEAEDKLAVLAEELLEKSTQYDAKRTQCDELVLTVERLRDTATQDGERARYEEERRVLEERIAQLEEDLRQVRMREETLRVDKQAQEESFALRERTYEERLAERDRLLGEERTQTETYLMQQSVESEAAHLEELKRREDAYRKERDQYELLLNEKEAQIEEEREQHKRDLEEQEAAIYKKLHDEMQHQSYLNLVNTPPPAPAPDPAEYSYYTAPIAEETPAPKETAEETDEYRTVVRRMYENTMQSEPAPRREERAAQPLDGVNFRDIEERAAADGIRVTTAGKKQVESFERSESIVHKGKALFLSALVLFFLCIIEGGIVLALRETYSLSAFWPYFIWAIGLAVLLITGLAYANHFGERALRRSSPALINAAVLYALAVIFVLIIALGVNIDFTSPAALASYIVIPIIWLFGIVVFGVTYWLQVKPLKD